MNEKKTPQAKFCVCKFEQVRAGVKVFVKGDGTFTTNRTEAAERAKFPVGKLFKLNGKITLRLNKKAEAALAA